MTKASESLEALCVPAIFPDTKSCAISTCLFNAEVPTKAPVDLEEPPLQRESQSGGASNASSFHIHDSRSSVQKCHENEVALLPAEGTILSSKVCCMLLKVSLHWLMLD